MVDQEKRVWDEQVINAYVDGELDAQTALLIEADMESDPALKTHVKNRQRLNSLLQGAYANVRHQPLGPELSRLDQQESPSNVHNIHAHRKQGWTQGLIAVAASFVILSVGFGAGFLTGEARVERQQLASHFERSNSLENMQAAWNKALEHTPSGQTVSWENETNTFGTEIIPVRTMRSKDDRYCREFREIRLIDGVQEERRGVSCRTGKEQWEMEALFSENDQSYF
ncbi:MAG: hypothetical protein ABW162_02425 [Candidatus Sedimenticola sp. PURPLELP]